MLFELLVLCLGVSCFAALVLTLYILRQGDAVFAVDLNSRTQARLENASEARLAFSVSLPLTNTGRQEGTILDAYLRIYLAQEQYDGLILRGKVNLATQLRADDYFEANLVAAGAQKELLLRFEAFPRGGRSAQAALAAAPDIAVALILECRGRKALYTKKCCFTLRAQELEAAAQSANLEANG